ncbi:MAG: Na(+)/H(+) antiporter subunit B, partial [Gammaproteobacteria bacterium]|nr:Na(+)/H(+) antiporter subunit B [Gammaproteobacteria bacterium]
MIKRLFIFLVLILFAYMFLDVAGNYQEPGELSPLATRYVDKGPDELGAANLVTAVVVTYRGLDTLGEVTVLFLSAAVVGLLLGVLPRQQENAATQEREKADSSELVKTMVEYLLPIIFVFGAYIFLNGHLTPGGGFQGGAVVASGVLLMFLALPYAKLRHALLSILESLSRFGYVLVGIFGLVLAGGCLDNRFLPLGDYGELLSAGAIPLIYIFIGLKVGTELSAVLEHFKS